MGNPGARRCAELVAPWAENAKWAPGRVATILHVWERCGDIERAAPHLALLTAALEPTCSAGHPLRTALLAQWIADAAGAPATARDQARLGALLHDLGKMDVPRAILAKPGALDPAEYALVRKHTLIGEDFCRDLGRTASAGVAAVARGHHERWDGLGYPDGLKAEAIPWAARVVALADAVDTMATPRCFRPAVAPERVLEELEADRGRQWDPDLARLFLSIADGVRWSRFAEFAENEERLRLAA